MADQKHPDEPTPQTADLIEDPRDEGTGNRSIENEDIRPQTADLIDNADEGAQGRSDRPGGGVEHEQGETMAAPSYSGDEDRLTDSG